MERLLRCGRCRMEFPASDLRIAHTGGWICRGCLAGKPETDLSPHQAADRYFEEKESSMQGMQTYKCRCGYVFQKSKDRKVARCPYCGRDPSAFVDEPSMQDMLDEESEE